MTPPEAFRKETIQTYAAGWPPVFLGDLAYYIEEFDLRDCASEIDTDEVAVHILTGDYDYSATVEHGRAAHQAIAGSTWSVMRDLDPYPRTLNPHHPPKREASRKTTQAIREKADHRHWRCGGLRRGHL